MTEQRFGKYIIDYQNKQSYELVDVINRGNHWDIEWEDARIFAHGKTEKEAVLSFVKYLDFLFEQYVYCDVKELTKDAVKYRNMLREYITVDTMAEKIQLLEKDRKELIDMIVEIGNKFYPNHVPWVDVGSDMDVCNVIYKEVMRLKYSTTHIKGV